MSPVIHSLVLPVFNEELILRELCSRIESCIAPPLARAGEDYEIILVNDGSTDRSEEVIHKLHRQDPQHIKLISLSRNFGQQSAITAGIDLAQGDTVTVLDADLQDPPEVILSMINKWREGWDVVYGVRKKREAEGLFKRLTAALFYRLLRMATPIDLPANAGDFRLLSHKAATALRSLREKHRFVRGMVSWVGFRQAPVPYVRQRRLAGTTKYPLRDMLRFAWDGFTGFSSLPLKIATYLGILSAGASLIIACWSLYVHFVQDRAVEGWAWLTITVLFLGGVQLLSVGVLGEYVGRIFEETKGRPLYLVDHTLGDFGEHAQEPDRQSG